MKRNDLRAMGLTPDQIDTIMTMNGADINREKAKAGQQTDKEVQRLRESCITLLELLDDPEAVRGILLHASRLYCEQERRKPAVKVKITYTPEQESVAQATLDALRAMFPAARVHESAKKAGVSAVFLTVTKPENPHNTKQNS